MHGETLNVLLVVLEGGRADHMGCYGYGRDTTPFLDQVARQGVRCTAAYTSAPALLPATASLLTGLFAHAHGATEESGELAPGRVSLAELLRGAGYRTAAFSPAPAVGPEHGLGRGFERFQTGRDGGRAADYARRASDRVLGRRDAGARRSTLALRDWLAAGGEPFFAFVSYRETDSPLPPPAPYDREFADGASAAVAWHDGALRYVDMRLREVADALAAAGRWDRTLLVVTATHGRGLDEAAAGELTPAALRVPLLLRAPGRVPCGFVVDDIAQLPDVAPTILSLCRVAAPDAPMQGRALLREAAATPGPGIAVAESFRRDAGDVRRKAIRAGRSQFVWRSDEANAFYDLGRDGDAGVNRLAEDVARADTLRRALFDWLASAEAWARAQGLSANGRPDAADGTRDATAE